MRRSAVAVGASFISALALATAVNAARGYFSHRVLDTARGRATPVPALSHRLVLVLFDGLRSDVAFAPGEMPTLDRLGAAGAQGIAITTAASMTGIGVRALGTGATASVEDIARNFAPEPVTFENLFALAQHAGLRVAFLGDRVWSRLYGRYGDARLALDVLDIRDTEECDRQVLEAARKVLASDDYDFVVLHFNGIDHMGHLRRSDSAAYRDKVHRSDAFLAELATPAFLRGGTLYVTSDHGSGPNGNHGDANDPLARRTPFVLYGAGAARGVSGLQISQLDVAPTLALLLGLPRPAAAEGAPVVEGLALSPAAKAAALVDGLVQRLAYLRALSRGRGALSTVSAGELASARASLSRGDYAGAAFTARAGFERAEDAYLASLTERPFDAWLYLATLLTGVAVLVAYAAGERASAAKGRALRAAGVSAAIAAAALAASCASARVALPSYVVALGAEAAALGLLARRRTRAAELACASVLVLLAAGALAILYADPFAFFIGTRHAWKLPAAVLVVLVPLVVAAIFRRSLLRLAGTYSGGGVLAALGLASLCHPEEGILFAVVLLAVLVAALAGHERRAPFRVGLVLATAGGAAVFLSAWVRTGYAAFDFSLGGRYLDGSPLLSTAVGLAAATLLARLVARARPRPGRVVLRVGFAACALGLLASSRLAPSTTLVNLTLVAAGAAVVVGCASRAGRCAGLVLGSLAGLEAIASGFERIGLPLVFALAAWIFPYAVRALKKAPPLWRAAIVAAVVVLLRLVIFGFTEGRFSIEALDFTVAFAGQGVQQNAVRPVITEVGRFALPFVPIVALALAALEDELRGKALALTAVFLAYRAVFLLILYRFVVGQIFAYVLMPELVFYLGFLAALVVAGAIAVAALPRRESASTSSSSPPTRSRSASASALARATAVAPSGAG